MKRIGATGSTEGLADIRSAMKEAFRSRSTDDWVTFLYEQPEIIWERIRGHEEVLADRQNIENGYITEVDLDVLGTTRTPGYADGVQRYGHGRHPAAAGAWRALARSAG